jgi:DNA-binding NtrC family response regulator
MNLKVSEKRVVVVDRLLGGSEVVTALTQSAWTASVVANLESAHRHLSRHPTQLGIIWLDGPQCAEAFAKRNWSRPASFTEWVALVPAALHDDSSVCAAIVEHCYDFHTLPLHLDRLLVTLGRARGMAALREEASTTDESHGDLLIGQCAAIRETRRLARKIAHADAPVLITGETGTGKEAIARFIHQSSRRRERAFVAVNCAALPGSLVQSELFGHERGAFTGAHAQRIGRLEAAAGGTLLLDEIGDLHAEGQLSLLRFLETRQVERVGGKEPIAVDVRVMAATNVDLRRAIREGRFREDLYYRLHVLQLEAPPLREREGDANLLADHFFRRYATEHSSRLHGFSERANKAIAAAHWPGNVRELMNSVQRGMTLADGRWITPEDLSLADAGHTLSTTLRQAREDAERDVIRACLTSNGHNVSRAADALEVSRMSLYRLLKKHGIGGHAFQG